MTKNSIDYIKKRKCYEQKNLQFTIIQSLLYEKSWNDESKKKIMINIRELNKIFKFDIYLMFLQSNVIVIIMNASYIFVMNYAKFFH